MPDTKRERKKRGIWFAAFLTQSQQCDYSVPLARSLLARSFRACVTAGCYIPSLGAWRVRHACGAGRRHDGLPP